MKATTGRIWEAASSFEDRPALNGVHFDAENATLTASDSYIAARVPCEVEDGDESGVIPREALKTANGKSLRVAGGKAVLTLPDGERVWNLLPADNAPDFDRIFRKAEVIEAPIGLNPDLLKKLGLAMNGSTGAPLALHPRAPRTAIRVGTQPDVIGLIMPVVIGALSRNGATPAPRPPDLSNDEAVIAACRAALAQLNRRRGKRKAADAFRAALSAALTETASPGGRPGEGTPP